MNPFQQPRYQPLFKHFTYTNQLLQVVKSMLLNVPFREASLPMGILGELQRLFLIIMHDLLTKLLGIALFSRQQQVKYMEGAHRTLSTAEPGTPQQPGMVVHRASPVRGRDQRARGQSAADRDVVGVAIRRGPGIVCTWRGAQALCCCFPLSDARKTGEVAAVKCCAQVLCYRK